MQLHNQPPCLMVAFPHCKINLGLQVIRKRADGYHDIATCFYPVPLTDMLEIIPARDFTFSFSGEPVPGDERENLCVKAFQILRREKDIPPVQMHLHKTIPMGAGLGGGSSDGAFTLTLLNEIFQLALSPARLKELASELGSDCAFFLKKEPQSGSGKGDELKELQVDLKGRFIVLVKPPVHISTARAYAEIIPTVPPMLPEQVVKNAPEKWKGLLKNDFEGPVFRMHPQIEMVKESMYDAGAVYASMTGSGAAVYGIFNSFVDMTMQFRGMFCWSSPLR
jgi:4-diphosphocytidyl-2-C-methyl-D-erythritol kinase